MPDARELPWMRRAVVPLVRRRAAVVGELVADRFPGRAAVVRALDDLPEPAAALRGVETVRIDGRSFDVIDLPAAEMRTADVPAFLVPSDVSRKAPLRVPTETRTLAIFCSSGVELSPVEVGLPGAALLTVLSIVGDKFDNGCREKSR